MKALSLISFAALASLPLAAQTPPAAPVASATVSSPDIMQAAKDMLAFTEAMGAIARSDKPAAEKVAAFEALKPRAAELCQLLDRVGTPAIRRAIRNMLTEEERERRCAIAMDIVDKNPELYDVFEEIDTLLIGKIPADTPPADVAAAFLATLREGATLVQNSALTGQDRLDALENQARRMRRFYPWVVAGGDSVAVADILIAGGEMDELIRQHEPLHRWAASEEDSELAGLAYHYESTLAEIMYVFYDQYQEEPETPNAP